MGGFNEVELGLKRGAGVDYKGGKYYRALDSAGSRIGSLGVDNVFRSGRNRARDRDRCKEGELVRGGITGLD